MTSKKKKAECCGKCDKKADGDKANDSFNTLIGALSAIGWQCALPKEGWGSKSTEEIGGLIVGTEEYIDKVLHCIEVAEAPPEPTLLARIKNKLLHNIFWGSGRVWPF